MMNVLRRTPAAATPSGWPARSTARPNPFVDPALATWSEILGREQARLWLNARASEGRGR